MRYGIEILPLPVMGGQVWRRGRARIWGKGKGGKIEEEGPLWSLYRAPKKNREA